MNRQQPRRGPDGRRTGTGLVVIILCLAACAMVAVAAAGEPLRDADGGFGRFTLTPWLVLVPVLALVALGLFGLTALRGAGGQRQTSRKPIWLTVLSFVVIAAVLSRLEPSGTSSEVGTFEIAPTTEDGGGQTTAWPTWLAIGGGAVIALFLLSRRRSPPTAPEPEDTVEQARRAIDASLAGLAGQAEPRAGVIAAYARLLEGLDGAGAGRRPAEAPLEHMARALATVGVRPEPVHRLTTLFAEARFSDHPITEVHRAEAERALADARSDLERVVPA